MQGHFESISQHCQVMFWQCLCNTPQRAYENIAMLVFCKFCQCFVLLSFGNVYARLPKEDMAILSGKCFASFMQGYFGKYMATLKGGLPASFIKGVPKGKWLSCHATFLQSLFKSVLVSTWQPAQMQSTTFIGCQGRFLRSLCKVVWRAFRNIARLSFGNVNARFPKNHNAILPHKCLASFMQGHFGEYMAILQNDLLAIFI